VEYFAPDPQKGGQRPGCEISLLILNGSVLGRDDNSGTGTRYPLGTRPDGYGDVDDFLFAGGTCTRPESRRVRDMYFFLPVDNPTGTRYFNTAIILGCEQVKICLFCYINYDLF
jgi:hypothetical protein